MRQRRQRQTVRLYPHDEGDRCLRGHAASDGGAGPQYDARGADRGLHRRERQADVLKRLPRVGRRHPANVRHVDPNRSCIGELGGVGLRSGDRCWAVAMHHGQRADAYRHRHSNDAGDHEVRSAPGSFRAAVPPRLDALPTTVE